MHYVIRSRSDPRIGQESQKSRVETENFSTLLGLSAAMRSCPEAAR